MAQIIATINLKHLQVVGQLVYFKEGDNSTYFKRLLVANQLFGHFVAGFGTIDPLLVLQSNESLHQMFAKIYKNTAFDPMRAFE